MQHYELKPVDESLMGQGITLELQFPIDKYRADFLINECLIVEINGAAYHTSKEAVARDTRRDKYIRRQGFHILRIPAKYPLYRSFATINKVRRAISIAAQDEVKKNYPEEERFFHLGAVNCGLYTKTHHRDCSKQPKKHYFETVFRGVCDAASFTSSNFPNRVATLPQSVSKPDHR